MIKIVTDSTSYMPKTFSAEHDIAVLPLKVILGETGDFEEGFPDAFEEAFRKVDAYGQIPTTSQPSPEKFMQVFNHIIENGDEVLVLTLAASLSGTFNAAKLGAKSCKDPSKITVIDSGACGPSMWGLIMEMLVGIRAGKNRAEISEHIEKLKINSGIYFCPDTLENLKKGGRIGSVKAIIGSLLKIKPLLSFVDGRLTNPKSVMGGSGAVKELVSRIPASAKRVFIIKIRDSKLFTLLKDGIAARFPKTEKIVADFGPVIGAHIGAAIGVAWTCE